MLLCKTCSSLDRIMPHNYDALPCRTQFSALRNEPLSFQVAYQGKDSPAGRHAMYVRIETALPLKFYRVGYVPVLHTRVPGLEPAQEPGLYGDMLLEKSVDPPLYNASNPWMTFRMEEGDAQALIAYDDCCQALYFTVNPQGKRLKPGDYPIQLTFFERDRPDAKPLATLSVQVALVDACLPRQTFLCTNWFYCDCLCDMYHVEPFSPEFYRIFRSYVRTAAENGMNMLLLPAFTPSLDTPLERPRRRIQLLRITREGGHYSFDFSEMEHFIRLARECGITHFEHAHLFTQWGATAAPDIYVTVDGREKLLFSRKTKASGAAYRKFLHAYLPALRAFLRELGLEKKVLFHISDEPDIKDRETYAAARATVGDLLDGCLCGDALSHYELYEEGLVPLPIVCTHMIHHFIGKCDDLWAYYTGGQVGQGLSNRLVQIPPERNRVLGIQMYANHVTGFLHWGYNFYYHLLSQGTFDPVYDPCGFEGGAGTCFLVYPGRDGEAIPSIRQKVFAEGILDYRALQAYEKAFGRPAADALLRDCFGEIDFHTQATADALLQFRQRLNQALESGTPAVAGA